MKHAEKTSLRLVANTRAVAVRRSGIASAKAAMVARRAPTRGFTKGRTHDGTPEEKLSVWHKGRPAACRHRHGPRLAA